MAFWGYTAARTGKGGPDEGVDVRANEAVAQVKAQTIPVGRPVVQRLAGISLHEKLDGLVFSLSGFTDEAVEWALEAGVALFIFDLQGVPDPLNDHAREIVHRTPEGWTAWLEKGWETTQEQVRREIADDRRVRKIPSCSWSGIRTIDNKGKVTFRTSMLTEEELEQLEGPMTREEYADEVVVTGIAWFAVDIKIEATLAGRIEDQRFHPYRVSEDPNGSHAREGFIRLRRIFRDPGEAAAWIAEVAISLEVSPYRDRWPEVNWDWVHWTQQVADEHGWP